MVRLLAFAIVLTAAQQEAPGRRIGDADPHAAPGTRMFVHPSPTLDAAVSSYYLDGKERFLLENGFEIDRPVKWVGWKLPEKKSVLVARAETGDGRVLLIGGAPVRELPDIWDAQLRDGAKRLVVVRRTGKGMVLEDGDRRLGPVEEIQLYEDVDDRAVMVVRDQGRARLRVGDREHALEGRVVRFFPSARGGRLAWIESLADSKERAVVDGVAGEPCDSVHAGIHFSPKGDHVAWVTRDGETYRGWIDGRPVRSERSVVAARVFDDGTPVWVEIWRETVDGGHEAYRGRLVVGGRPQERVLERPIYNLDFEGDRLYGASRLPASSVVATIHSTGEVEYEEFPARIGTLLLSPDGRRRAFTFTTGEGLFAQIDGERRGPFDRCQLFHLRYASKFGYVAERHHRVLVAVEGKSTLLPLTAFVDLRLVDYEMTAAVIGVRATGKRKEIWASSVPLE